MTNIYIYNSSAGRAPAWHAGGQRLSPLGSIIIFIVIVDFKVYFHNTKDMIKYPKKLLIINSLGATIRTTLN